MLLTDGPVNEEPLGPPGQASMSLPTPRWLLPTLWVVLGLLLCSLLAMAVFLLVKMDLFSGEALTDEQLKSLWAFLGVALGAVVTLIGTLLTEQHNRRTAAFTREAAERERIARRNQEELAKQAEKRLTIDTIGKTLELISDGSEHTQRARVAGAIATMMELEGGAVAVRILGELWAADAVDSDTAVWLVNRVLESNAHDDEVEAAADLLVFNVSKLVPAVGDSNQDRENWPSLLRGPWPQGLSFSARNSLFVMGVKLLLSRELDYWKARTNFPVRLISGALVDEEFKDSAAFVLATLHHLGVLEALDAVPVEADDEEIRSLSESFIPMDWFERLVEQFEPWARGDVVGTMMQGSAPVATGQTRTS